MKTPEIETTIKAMDEKLNARVGYSANTLWGWYETLLKTGSVEVGWRASCGSTDRTMFDAREWMKIVKKMRAAGMQLAVEPVKHKNGWATKGGGFWNSEVFRLINHQREAIQ